MPIFDRWSPLVAGFIGLCAAKFKIRRWSQMEPQDPSTLNEAEKREQKIMRQAFSDMGLSSEEDRLRFIPIPDAMGYVTYCDPIYSLKGSLVIVIKPPALPNSENQAEWDPRIYAVSGHEAVHARDLHPVITVAAPFYVSSISYDFLRHCAHQFPKFKKFYRFPLVSLSINLSIAITFAHYFHSQLELSAHQQSANKLGTGADLYDVMTDETLDKEQGRVAYLDTTTEMLIRFLKGGFLKGDIGSLGQPGLDSQKKVLFESIQKNLENVGQPRVPGTYNNPLQWGRSFRDISKGTSKFFKTNIPDTAVVEKSQEPPTVPNLKKP